jgi:nitrate reductase gamma subunit
LALTYLAVLVFAIGVILRALKYARAPMHLRWELYPVPHEKGKGDYGGSYFEEIGWWSKPRETSLLDEIGAMLEEMLLIRSLWHRNRGQWYASFPFHGGIYLLFGFTLLLALGAVAETAGLAGAAWFGLLEGLTLIVGAVGLVAGIFGALSLLWRRLTDEKLKASSNLSDYVNLLVILAVFLTAAFAWLAVDPSFSQLRGFMRGALTLSPPARVAPAIATEIVVAALFLIYLPFTHMTHFVAKYFTYHQVRWDDAPNLNDPRMIARIEANLARPVGWSAPHIQSGKSWAEVATEVK